VTIMSTPFAKAVSAMRQHQLFTYFLLAFVAIGTSPGETMIWTRVFALALPAAAVALTVSFPNRLVSA